MSGEEFHATVRPLGRIDPWDLFLGSLRGRMPFFLDSSLRDQELGRYSAVGSNPIGWFRSSGPLAAYASPWGEGERRGDPLEALGEFLDLMPWATAGRPPYPFVGGLVGYFSYDLGRTIERVPEGKGVDLGLPAIHLGLYSPVVLVDHVWHEAYTMGLRPTVAYDPPPIPRALEVSPDPNPAEPLEPEAYMATIGAAREAIAEGQIFQVNLSRRYSLPLEGAPPEAYQRLRTATPSTFGGYLDAGDHQVLSASPELFLRVRGRCVETRPIKGTRPRGRTPAEDDFLARELQASEKDAAENVMIVDLERNDLGKVCTYGSIEVPVLRRLRTLPTVHHLESVVRGCLRPHVTIPGLLRATFPGGSITGAPKPRAMEVIEGLEPHRRGIYTGALGCISFDRSLDLNVAIRTATVLGSTAYFAVGGGIVADSDPLAEYRETLDKLRGHAEALTRGRVEVTADGLRLGQR